MANLPHFKVKKSKDDKWYFTVVGRNGKVQATSETYDRAYDASMGIHDLIETVSLAQEPRILVPEDAAPDDAS